MSAELLSREFITITGKISFIFVLWILVITYVFASDATQVIAATKTGTNAGAYVINPMNTHVLTDGKLHLYLCGTGDPEVTMQEIRKPACVAMIAEQEFMLFDAGEGTIQTLGAMGLPYTHLRHIFMTHWHSDHFGGLGQVINASWVAGNAKNIFLYGPYGTKQVLNALGKAYRLDVIFRAINRQGIEDPTLAFAKTKEFKTNPEGKLVYQKNNLQIHAFQVHHEPAFPAVGYRIHYKNCKVVISGDTRVVKSLRQNATNADILINEALSHHLYEQIISKAKAIADYRTLAFAKENKRYHSDTLLLAQMANKANVKKLVLTHLVPAIPTTDEAKESFIQGMNQFYSGPITVADDQDEIILDSEDSNCHVEYKKSALHFMPAQKIN